MVSFLATFRFALLPVIRPAWLLVFDEAVADPGFVVFGLVVVPDCAFVTDSVLATGFVSRINDEVAVRLVEICLAEIVSLTDGLRIG